MFYGIKNIYKMDSVKFNRLAFRVSAYSGVIAGKAAAQAEEQERGSSPSFEPATTAGPAIVSAKNVEAEDLNAVAGFEALISWGDASVDAEEDEDER